MTTQTASTAAADVQTEKKNGLTTPARQVPGLAVFTGLLVLVQHVWVEHAAKAKWPVGPSLFVVVIAALGLYWLIRARNSLVERLGSAGFAVTILLFLGAATAAGTMTPQQMTRPDQPVGLGDNLAGLLFLNDVFHSLWYAGLLGLLSLSLIVTVLQRPFWKPYYWGFLLAHCGLVIVVVGGSLGRWYGETGRMNLRVGQSSNSFQVIQRGIITDQAKPLDFALRLDAFDVEKYPHKYPPRLMVFQMKAHEENPMPICTHAVKEAGSGFTVPNTDLKVQVKEFYPDIQVTDTMVETNNTDMPPSAEIRLKEGSEEAHYWLVGGFSPHMALHASGLDVEWGDLKDTEWLNRTKEGRPARHWITLPGSSQSILVQVGQSYPIPGDKGQFTVQAFYPDFRIDMETREASSASDQPLNPSLQIEVQNEKGERQRQYLFPGAEGHMGKENALELAYRFEAGSAQITHLIRLDGAGLQFAYAFDGREIFRSPFELGKPVEIPLERASGQRTVEFTVLNILQHAQSEQITSTLSQEPRNPGVRVEISSESQNFSTEALLIAKGEESWTEIGPDLILAMDARDQEVKSWKSHVSVLRDGQLIRKATIAVNAPLSYEGYAFYQSDADESDPNYSGLRVAKDPGVGVAFAGMILVCLGATYTLYVRPRLRKEAGVEEAA